MPLSSDRDERHRPGSTQGVLDFCEALTTMGSIDEPGLELGKDTAEVRRTSANGKSREESKTQAENLPLTAGAVKLLTKKTHSYRVSLKSLGRDIAAAQEADAVSLIHVEQASTLLRIQTRPRRKYLGILGGLFAGAALSNLFEILAKGNAEGSVTGIVLLIVLLLGVAGIALEWIKHR